MHVTHRPRLGLDSYKDLARSEIDKSLRARLDITVMDIFLLMEIHDHKVSDGANIDNFPLLKVQSSVRQMGLLATSAKLETDYLERRKGITKAYTRAVHELIKIENATSVEQVDAALESFRKHSK